MGGTGRPLGKTFFLHCQRRHPELPKIPTYLPGGWLGQDKASDYWDVFEDLLVLAAVEKVCQKNNLNFFWVYDLACKVATKR